MERDPDHSIQRSFPSMNESPLYTKGWLAVDLFFSLSGFIFYWLYARRVAEIEISATKFMQLRFSRLYPLHLATLLIVVFLQMVSMNSRGSYFVYSNNDIYHFVLNLLFASSWGFERLFLQWPNLVGFRGGIAVRAFLRLLSTVAAASHRIGRHFDRRIPRHGKIRFSSRARCRLVFLGGCVFLAYQAIVASNHCCRPCQMGYLFDDRSMGADHGLRFSRSGPGPECRSMLFCGALMRLLLGRQKASGA